MRREIEPRDGHRRVAHVAGESFKLAPLLGFYLERYILITPSLIPAKAVLAGASVTPFGVVELGIAAGFVGLFFICFLGFAKVFPGTLSAKS